MHALAALIGCGGLAFFLFKVIQGGYRQHAADADKPWVPRPTPRRRNVPVGGTRSRRIWRYVDEPTPPRHSKAPNYFRR